MNNEFIITQSIYNDGFDNFLNRCDIKLHELIGYSNHYSDIKDNESFYRICKEHGITFVKIHIGKNVEITGGDVWLTPILSIKLNVKHDGYVHYIYEPPVMDYYSIIKPCQLTNIDIILELLRDERLENFSSPCGIYINRLYILKNMNRCTFYHKGYRNKQEYSTYSSMYNNMYIQIDGVTYAPY